MAKDNGSVPAPAGGLRAELRPVGEWDGEDAPQQLIIAIYLATIEDAIEAMRAADTLGLGVRVHNRWLDEEDDTLVGEWVVDVFDDALHVGS